MDVEENWAFTCVVMKDEVPFLPGYGLEGVVTSRLDGEGRAFRLNNIERLQVLSKLLMFVDILIWWHRCPLRGRLKSIVLARWQQVNADDLVGITFQHR